MAKLTADQVLDIRALARSGVTQSAIARRHGVGRSTVRDILSGRTWGPTTDETGRRWFGPKRRF